MTHAAIALLGAVSLAATPATGAAPEPRFLFDLATSAGLDRSTWAALSYDREHDEILASYGGIVHVFNSAGMEFHSFGGDGDLGSIERVALLQSGEILVLSYVNGHRAIIRCDYRGERIGDFVLQQVPERFAKFEPDLLLVQHGKVYLVQTGSMKLVIADEDGIVAHAYDLWRAVATKDPALQPGMGGFAVDAEGDLIFTMPYAFTAFVMSPAGELRQFGIRGSSPGKFNIAGAIATDEHGNVFVLDRLRSVVMIFDRSLKFVLEFGYRGEGVENLISPFDLAVGNGKVFVSQARDRGVRAFRY